MKSKNLLFTVSALFIIVFHIKAQDQSTTTTPRIDMKRDLLLVQYDCKTDVDDLHSVAAFRTMLNNAACSKINYHAVAGAYGIQDGLYVPPNDLFQLSFGKNWSDAHSDFKTAIQQVKKKAFATLKQGGDIWIAEAGQSDFTYAVLKTIQDEFPNTDTKKHIHVVQHSNWNEDVTTPEQLAFVKANTDYHKIPDGNAVGNGSPGFRSPEFTEWQRYINDPALIKTWKLAIELGNRYNGKDGRYNNEAVAAGGLDFSDTAEVCWILGLENLSDAEAFFNNFRN